MLSLQTIDAHGSLTEELAYDDPINEDPEEQLIYLSVDPAETETGLHLRLALLEADTNKRLVVDVLCQSKRVAMALIEALSVTFQAFPPQDFVVDRFWLVEDAPF